MRLLKNLWSIVSVLFFFVLVFSSYTWATTSTAEVTVGDAYVQSGANNQSWTIGTSAVRMSLAHEDGRLVLKGLENLLAGDSV